VPIVHQLNINQVFTTSNVVSLMARSAIAVVGIAESATFPVNTLTRIQSESDLTKLGGATDNTLTPEVKILQEYGCANIFVVRVAKGVDAPTTETNIIGSEAGAVRTGVYLFKEIFAQFRETLRFILIPNYNSAAVVTAGLAVASATDAFLNLDFPAGSTVATITTTRATAVGLGTKNARLLTFAPKLKRGANLESLATHSTGLIAKVTYFRGYGFTASNELFIPAVTGVETGFTLSYTDPAASNQLLERQGVMSANLSTDGFTAWGNRNSLYVDSVVETLDTYYIVQRIKQHLNTVFTTTGMRFLDENCDFSNAKLLEAALNNNISDNVVKGNLKTISRATFNPNLSDFVLRTLTYDISIGCNLPIELITINTQYSINI
jgi:hypothetical protein